ncbi:DUF6531 domain-containing protein [Streptomyces sp. NRRL S-1868]|uniref:DUF6531 domain-containing protein n=1 Tax=Streptomyces sp. NRRL S-1868 TaxID=1463892 RepID=UPI00069074B8|nr:DUF6531 domain-containing protein [Streptomyces sp. NRRL S-1868]
MAVVLPDWLDKALDVVGIAWPNVDEDAYRDMADALRDFADDMDDDSHSSNRHIQRLLSSGEGEALTALSEHWDKVKGKQGDIAAAARKVAGAMDAAAGVIEGMKLACIGHLSAMLTEAGISLAAAPFTFGLSTLISGGAIATTRTVVKKLIKEAGEEAVGLILSALAEPATTAIADIAADLAVQAGANAMGLQKGIDTGQAVQAGKDGFKEGVQSGKQSMHLASAGGGGGLSGLMKNLGVDHGEHDRATTDLTTVSGSVKGRTKGKLKLAKGHHNRTRGKDSIARVIDPVADRAVKLLTKAADDMGDHLGGGLSQGVKNNSKGQKNTDHDARDRLSKIRAGHDGDSGGHSRPSGDGKNSPSVQPDSARDVRQEPRNHAIPEHSRTCKTDPVDVASGEMVLAQTDLSLPGVLPLVLRRTHLSGYHYGQFFGRSWASTLDERLELDGAGAIWVREDGSLLVYPRLPRSGQESVLPVEGPQLPLTYGGQNAMAETSYRVTDPHTGLTLTFTGSPYRPTPLYWLASRQDRNGNGIEIVRQETGIPTAVVHDGGYHATLTTDPGNGRVTALSLRTAEGPIAVLTYGYDAAGNLTEVTNSSGLPLRFAYDDAARIVSWTDRNDSTYRYVYDAAGRVTETIGPEGNLSSRFTYTTDPATAERLTRYTDSTGATTTFRINELRQVVAETDPAGHTTRQEWDRYDHLLSRTDALGHTTSLTWDEAGNLTAVHQPDGAISTAEYNALNLPVEITGPDGAVWRQEYDEHGNRTAVTAPDGTITRFTCDARGSVATVTDATGATQHCTSDEAGLPLSVTDALGNTTTVTRDAFGRPVTLTDPLGAVTRLEWTTEGQLSRRTAPDGSQESFTWDGEGNCTSHTDPLGGLTRFAYTHFDKLAARTTPDGARYEFTYDTELRLTSVLNPQGLTWDYTYDTAGRLTAESDFDDRTVTYDYDAAGRLTSRTTPLGQSIRYELDAAGRPVAKNADGTRTTYAYDTQSRLIRATSPTSSLTLERDVLGQITAETVDGRTTRYTYDPLGRRTSRTTPTGAHTSLTYDPAGNRTHLSVDDHTHTFTHDPLGRELTHTFGTANSPVTLTSAWDQLGRLTEQSLSTQARTLRARAYAYRPDNHLTSLTDQLTGTTQSFGLDPVGRPLSVTAEDWTETYAYDTAGNQTNATWPDPAPHPEARGERTYTGTKLLTAGALRYKYDSAGRTVLRQKTRLSRKPDTWRYTWDAEDRLTTCTTPDGTLWRYLYDPLGRRTAKQRLADDGETVLEETRYTWDGTRLAEEANSASGVTLTWDHDGYRPLTQLERKPLSQDEVDSRFFAIVTDLVGTPTELVDETGEIAWHTRATLWGTTTWNRDATAYTPLRFPGQYADPETGLHYNYFRHYDPDTARYLTPDPLGLVPAPNPATYVDNPHAWTDPLGLAPCPESIDPRDIRLSQNSVRDAAEIIESMRKNGWNGDPIQVVEMPDGGLTTIDNTRVVAARHAGINTQAVVHKYDEPLPDQEQIDRFTTRKGVPESWGDALSLRIGKQAAGYRNRYPMGSPLTAWDGN